MRHLPAALVILALSACAQQSPMPQASLPATPPSSPPRFASPSAPPPQEDAARRSPGPGYVLTNDSPSGIGFLHMDTIERRGDLVSVWIVINFFPHARSAGIVSLLTRDQFDCRRRLRRIIGSNSYSGYSLTGRGGDWYSTPNAPWDDIRPNSVGDNNLKTVCQHTGWSAGSPSARAPRAAQPTRPTQPF